MDQRLMRLVAEKQADDRSLRAGVACFVYRRVGFPGVADVTWYVRTRDEGEPEGASLEYITRQLPNI